jgi:hypothetical protein
MQNGIGTVRTARNTRILVDIVSANYSWATEHFCLTDKTAFRREDDFDW